MENYTLKSSKTQSWISGSDFESATPKRVDVSYGLITFLGVAQKLGIKFLPITWQPALDHIGRGATAEIREASMSLRARFAFKRPIFQTSSDSWELESRILPSLIAEMSILADPSIRRHPNIIQLEGICWEILSGDGEAVSRDKPIEYGKGGIVPVLVFEKADDGDLSSFMMHSVGKTLNFRDRLEICTAIAKAVAAMHSYSIIHGDIKPQNVLLFRNISGGYTAKVADFGYSSKYALPSDLIYMPRSWPWAAPEWHHRGFTAAQATKMDTYSFGMLVLWVLFYSAEDDSDIRFLRGLRAATGALALANQLIQPKSQPKNIDLLQFFNITLTCDVAFRCSDFKFLIHLLAPEKTVDPPLTEQLSISLDVTNVHFQIAPSVYQFYQNDYRVRLYVADRFLKKLLELEDRPEYDLRSQNILLQCIFCYNIGFGTARDSQLSRELYERFKLNETDFYREFDAFDHGIYLPDSESFYQSMLQEGHIRSLDLAQTYRGQVSLDKLEVEYRREIADVETALGQDHPVVTLLKRDLSSILTGHGQWDKAEQLDLQIVDVMKRTRGEKNPETLASMSNLASIYMAQDRYQEAKELGTQVTEERKRILGEEHPDTFQGMMNLIPNILEDQSQLQEAEELQLQIVQRSSMILGEEHQDTLGFMEQLVRIYTNQRRWTEAVELAKWVIQAGKRVLGDEHPQTLTSIHRLITIYRLQGRWNEAEELDLKNLKTSETIFEKADPQILTGMSGLASVYGNQERWKDAEAIEMKIIDITREVLGEEHEDTLSSIGQLATTFREQRRWKEAQELEKYVFETERRVLGEDHPVTIVSMTNLASTYRSQAMWKETEELDLQIIEKSKRVLGEEHPNTLTNISNLAWTYWWQRRWEESLDLDVHVMDLRKRVLGEDHPSTLESMHQVASTYDCQGYAGKAIELMAEVAQRRLETLGADHDDTIDSRDALETWIHDSMVDT